MNDPVVDFGLLFELAPNPYMLLDTQLRYVAANRAYLDVTGSDLETLIGRSVFDAFPGDPDNPEDENVAQLRRSFERVIATGEPDYLALIPYTMPRQTADGIIHEERFWSASHTPIKAEDGKVRFILQHTVDVTDLQQMKYALRQAEAALDAGPVAVREEGLFRRARLVQENNRLLDRERKQLRRLFDLAPGFVAVLAGPEHVFDLVNTAYLQLVGHRNVAGKPVEEALPEVRGQGFIELLDTVFRTGEPFIGRSMRVMLQRVPGSEPDEVFVDFVYQSIVESDGTISGIFVEGHDVTLQVKAQKELQALNDQLEQRVAVRTAELERRNRELQEFAYAASHDLQEPLRKIHAFSDLLEEEYSARLDEQGRQYLDRIRYGVRRMSELIRDLLTYSRVSMEINGPREVALETILQDVLQDLQPEIDAAGGRVDVEPIDAVHADVGQMRRLFENLLSNAIKFRREGVPPVVKVRARKEEADGRRAVRIEVADNGIGFEPQYAERIFTPFQRLHAGAAFDGTGIGLAICRRIIERHNGSIFAESTPGSGSTFIVRLPAAEDE